MRTRTLLALAATVAIAIPASAQVYSANIVGYVNVPLVGNGGLTLVANPLKPSNGDYNITNTVPVMPDEWDGATVFKWLGTDWDPNNPGYIAGYGWFPDANIALGESFFVASPAGAAPTTVTFVGEVQTGTSATAFNPGMNFVAPKIPLGTPWPGSTVGNDGDTIFTWDVNTQAWSDTAWNFIADYGWYATGDPSESTAGPAVTVGNGVAYYNLGAAVNFNETFNP